MPPAPQLPFVAPLPSPPPADPSPPPPSYGGTPKASPSAPVCAWPVPSATTPGPQHSQTLLHRYDPITLHALNPGRSNTCFQATPKRTHGPFACHTCKLTFHHETNTTTSPRAINHLKCILINARSVHKHAVELWDLLDSTAPDLAFITETWMNASSAPDIAIAIPEGYKISRKDCTDQVGGGIAIVFKDSISVTTSTSTEDTPLAAEHLHLQIRTDPRTTLRGYLIYPPPDRASSSATPSPTSSPRTPSPDYILLGDLNFHLEQNNDPNTTALLANLANLGLKQLVNTPTHIAGHTLDPIFSASKHVSFSHASALHWTDHNCVHFTFRRETRHLRNQPILRRQWNKIPEEQLFSMLIDNQPIFAADPNDAALSLTNWITNCADNLAPLRCLPRQSNTKKPLWFSDALKESKKTCRALEKAWRKDHSADNMTALKNATREHHHLIRAAKRNFFTDRQDKNSHNSRELFSIVKEFSNPNANAITPSQDPCKSLPTFFHRKITDLHDSFGHQTQLTNTEPTPPAITLNAWTHINTEETKTTMNSIHSGAPSDPCPHFIFNKADNIIAPHLRTIINSSFSSATFPKSWKHADSSVQVWWR
ncbi:hypothetical protein NDU88_000484 [Pleurodeles waltl]|uniref:Endonuclease/exonuclease/phosphatase domain-containing protein n=1 Tax=Pleurodeles waltl TaxID=8319 RepID=A0AAV7WFN3_PLEWA|nr:hypothetical protein NDU88_000484 [Pleurodeles waltl]